MGVSIVVPAAWGRGYFALQALAGACWWVAVFTVPLVRSATLGDLPAPAIAILDVPLFVGASALAACGFRAAGLIATGWTLLVTLALAAYATLTAEAGWGVLLMLAASGCSLLAASALLIGRMPTEWIVRGPFGFRLAARGRSAAAHLFATLGQIAVFWGFFLGVLPALIAFLERRWGLAVAFPPGMPAVGALIFLLASGLGLWAGVTMSTLGDGTPLPVAMPRLLVVAGPYRWVRNPMAVAGIAQGVAVGLMLESWLVIGYALLGSQVWNLAVRPFEEADLLQRFGDQFARYRDNVRCWLPRRTPWEPAPA